MNNTSSRYPNSADNRIAGVPSATRELQIPREMSILAASLDEQDKLLTVLTERLNPLLRSELPQPACENVKEAEQLVPFAERVRSLRCQVQRQNERIQDLTSRFEA